VIECVSKDEFIDRFVFHRGDQDQSSQNKHLCVKVICFKLFVARSCCTLCMLQVLSCTLMLYSIYMFQVLCCTLMLFAIYVPSSLMYAIYVPSSLLYAHVVRYICFKFFVVR